MVVGNALHYASSSLFLSDSNLKHLKLNLKLNLKLKHLKFSYPIFGKILLDSNYENSHFFEHKYRFSRKTQNITLIHHISYYRILFYFILFYFILFHHLPSSHITPHRSKEIRGGESSGYWSKYRYINHARTCSYVQSPLIIFFIRRISFFIFIFIFIFIFTCVLFLLLFHCYFSFHWVVSSQWHNHFDCYLCCHILSYSSCHIFSKL